MVAGVKFGRRLNPTYKPGLVRAQNVISLSSISAVQKDNRLVMTCYADLSFDAVAHICFAAWETDNETLREMSLLDKRTRAACIPLIFRKLIFDCEYGESAIPWTDFTEEVENLLRQEIILKAVRYGRVYSIFLLFNIPLDAFIFDHG